MKTLSVRQPWASLICTGIKDVENRSWKTNYRGKLLIHSSGFICPSNVAAYLPVELGCELFNQDTYGNIDQNDLVSSAIIGYVDLVDCVDGEYDSLWAEDNCMKFVLKDAYVFDEPILGVKGKLHLFDYDMDEDHLPPAHKVNLRAPRIEGDVLVLPVSNAVFDNSLELEGEQHIFLYDTDDTLDLFCHIDEAKIAHLKELEEVQNVRIEALDGRERTFAFNGIEWNQEFDDDGKPITLPNMLGEDTNVWLFRVFME